MPDEPAAQVKTTLLTGRAGRWARKVIGLALAGLLLGWLYGWASPKVFPEGAAAGFWRGVVHGFLMPMALPSLLMGKDVPIYQINNSGRGYKLGYIAGINFCGVVFFGMAFWQPARKVLAHGQRSDQ